MVVDGVCQDALANVFGAQCGAETELRPSCDVARDASSAMLRLEADDAKQLAKDHLAISHMLSYFVIFCHIWSYSVIFCHVESLFFVNGFEV